VEPVWDDEYKPARFLKAAGVVMTCLAILNATAALVLRDLGGLGWPMVFVEGALALALLAAAGVGVHIHAEALVVTGFFGRVSATVAASDVSDVSLVVVSSGRANVYKLRVTLSSGAQVDLPPAPDLADWLDGHRVLVPDFNGWVGRYMR